MDEAELETQLTQARTNEEWVGLVAAFFAAHELWFGHGTTNADDEAYWLVRHLQDWDEQRWAMPAEPGRARAAAQLAARRVRERRPLAYLINEAWFAGDRYFVDERVLVPRSPLAELIERCLAPWLALRAGDRVLDIGTGSGCLAIAVARHCPGVVVDATDNSRAALEVAAINVARHGVGERVHLELAELYPSGSHQYRAIIANPPYVPESEHAGLPAEYLHEPRAGLVGGRDGTDLAVQILSRAGSRLTPDGALFLEVGVAAEALAARVPRLELTWLEFERGGEGVCFVTAQDLERWVGRRGADE